VKSKCQRGATLVEFVITMPVAVLLVLALLQTGMLYMARITLNHATFMAARAGSLNNANMNVITNDLIRGLSPFYQDSTDTNDTTRLTAAWTRAKLDTAIPTRLQIQLLNPSKKAFADFGIKDSIKKVTYIPNDNLQWRSSTVGKTSQLSIQDANLLKLRVVYAYELKIPFVSKAVEMALCSGAAAVNPDCLKYYMQGRIPIESFAIVEMQSRAEP